MSRLDCHLLVLGLAVGGIALAGCSGGSTVDAEHVHGLVTLDGEPVPEATVTFVPVNEGEGMSAVGRTDEEGVYTLNPVGVGATTADAGTGTLSGEYYVGVVKTIFEEVLSQEEAMEQGIEYVEASDPGESTGEGTYVVPKKYNDPRASDITVTVKEGENDIPIVLTSE